MSEQLDNYVYYVVLVRQFLLLNWCGFFIWYRFPNSMPMTWLFCIVFLLIREYFTNLGTSSLSVYDCSIKNYARHFIMVFEQGGIFMPYLFDTGLRWPWFHPKYLPVYSLTTSRHKYWAPILSRISSGLKIHNHTCGLYKNTANPCTQKQWKNQFTRKKKNE